MIAEKHLTSMEPEAVRERYRQWLGLLDAGISLAMSGIRELLVTKRTPMSNCCDSSASNRKNTFTLACAWHRNWPSMPDQSPFSQLVHNSIRALTSLLDSLKIRYALLGGIAVQYWGHLRFTMDVDLVIGDPGTRKDVARHIVRNGLLRKVETSANRSVHSEDRREDSQEIV